VTDLTQVEELKNTCPKEGCNGCIVISTMQKLPVLECPEAPGETFIVGRTMIPEELDCPLLRPDEDS
jgi:hypothetical protein